jgi:protein TonB
MLLLLIMLNATAPVPLASPAGWTDYPMQALRMGEQGTVGFEVTVGPDGRVTDCHIVQTSASAILDAEVCRQISTRGRFRPATDNSGSPVIGSYRGKVSFSSNPQ